MDLYLYRIGTAEPLLRFEKALSYTDSRVVTEEGVYEPLAENCELSSLPDCSETLRTDWAASYPSQETRIEQMESLMAELLFGGDGE
ncbi:hypothetical protein [Oscillibacter sp.]|uniref:hypothetical protein n=1 Tax=Oscillibacter sp. TaxID=1945593 RepID=UPI001B580CAE|nr:hypothetical protein [Oscillibacter sp.]MBP3509417.1 hypothetical protein [Oscillibacter sp.]